MRRRDLISLAAGTAAAWPMAVRAQQVMRKLGVLMIVAEDDPDSKRRIAAFRQGLEGFLGTDVMACPLRASTRCGARTW